MRNGEKVQINQETKNARQEGHATIKEDKRNPYV